MNKSNEVERVLDLNNISFNDFYTEMSRFDKEYSLIDYVFEQIFENDAIQIYLDRHFIGMALGTQLKHRVFQKW